MKNMDFNTLSRLAKEEEEACEYVKAKELWYFIALDEPSLDDGYVAYRIGKCAELQGNIHEAAFWYDLAAKESGGVDEYMRAYERAIKIVYS